MDDFREMYCQLFNKITDIIEQLQQVQQQTEEMYIERGQLTLFPDVGEGAKLSGPPISPP